MCYQMGSTDESLSKKGYIITAVKNSLNSQQSGIHLEKDMCVPSGHTVAKTMCLFEMLCAPN